MLPCLHLAQEADGYVTRRRHPAVAEAIGVKPDEVESVVTFYSMYTPGAAEGVCHQGLHEHLVLSARLR